MDIKISRVTRDNIELLKKVAEQTFCETFAHLNTAEDMKKYLQGNFNNLQLAKELKNPDSSFFFAIVSGKVAGYLKLNFGRAQMELKEDNGMEIERLYVLQEFQGKKIGQLLYDKAFETAKSKKKEYIWLGVWEDNQLAIHFYCKNGFVEFDKHTFMLGDDKQTDIMMRRIL